mmetsp:Transcript_8757/g.18864  ORF Transcript_8757/g.18864 Transcript_8757/m.18864 type:complete len:121 (+) Transcript_8757:1407-1769(+)
MRCFIVDQIPWFCAPGFVAGMEGWRFTLGLDAVVDFDGSIASPTWASPAAAAAAGGDNAAGGANDDDAVMRELRKRMNDLSEQRSDEDDDEEEEEEEEDKNKDISQQANKITAILGIHLI